MVVNPEDDNPQYPLLPPRETAAYGPLKAWAERHWKQFQRRFYRQLKESGKLDEALNQAIETTIRAQQQYENAGLQPFEARELAYQNFLFPDEKQEQKSLNDFDLE